SCSTRAQRERSTARATLPTTWASSGRATGSFRTAGASTAALSRAPRASRESLAATATVTDSSSPARPGGPGSRGTSPRRRGRPPGRPRLASATEADDEVDSRAAPQRASEPGPLRADVASIEERRVRAADRADAAVGAGKDRSRLGQLEALHLLDIAQSGLRESHAEAALGR